MAAVLESSGATSMPGLDFRGSGSLENRYLGIPTDNHEVEMRHVTSIASSRAHGQRVGRGRCGP